MLPYCLLNRKSSLSIILLVCGGLRDGHDLSNRPALRKAKPSHLHLDLFHSGFGLRDVNESLWHCSEIDIWW